jgi:hypothetical protein
MPDVALHVANLASGVSLIPVSIELFGDVSQLHDQVAGQVFGLGLSPLLPPQADSERFRRCP